MKQQKEISLYKKRENIYQETQFGFFYKIRTLLLIICLLIYFCLPWFSFEARPVILFDIPNRIFYIFHLVFFPKDTLLLSYILMILILFLFFVTVLYGRVWCGFLCPQTIWCDLFFKIEVLIEGNRRKRIQLDNFKNDIIKIFKKLQKHIFWFILSFFTAVTFITYFVPVKVFYGDLFNLKLDGWSTFWIFFVSFGTYINAGWLREQVCFYMCPYARFQSVMFDRDTITVSYNFRTGEPRGKRARFIEKKYLNLGYCINCYKCKHVCPTGIDIRDGLQMECIDCGACIDACNSVMKKMEYPLNLISYISENKFYGLKTKFFRFRSIGYVSVLIFILFLLFFSLYSRVLFDVSIYKDRNVLYRIHSDTIENIYIMKIKNMSKSVKTYSINIIDPNYIRIRGKNIVTIEAYDSFSLFLHLEMEREYSENIIYVNFKIIDINNNDSYFIEKNVFINPTFSRKQK